MWRTLANATELNGPIALSTPSLNDAATRGDPQFRQVLTAFTDWVANGETEVAFTRSIPFFARTIRLVIEEVEMEQTGEPQQKRARNS